MYYDLLHLLGACWHASAFMWQHLGRSDVGVPSCKAFFGWIWEEMYMLRMSCGDEDRKDERQAQKRSLALVSK